MKRFKFLYFVLASSLFVIGYFIVSGLSLSGTEAADETNNLMRGFAWSSNIGWISLSCANDHDAFIDGVQPVCSPHSPSSDYQVEVEPFLLGKFIGYAWNGASDPENPGVRGGIGWIQFNPAGPYPDGCVSTQTNVCHAHL